MQHGRTAVTHRNDMCTERFVRVGARHVGLPPAGRVVMPGVARGLPRSGHGPVPERFACAKLGCGRTGGTHVRHLAGG